VSHWRERTVNSGTGPIWAIVLAAGSGARFGRPKQFEKLDGRRLVDRAVDAAMASCDACVVVVPAGVDWDGPAVAACVAGGRTRGESVRAGLTMIPADVAVVVVHDAAHPLASRALFADVIAGVHEGFDGAVPVVPLRETVMRVDGSAVVAAVERTGLTAVQMPHAFRSHALRAVHTSGVDAIDEVDDASLVFATGGRIRVVPGDVRNIHVTTAAELELASRLVSTRSDP
jgi:2-C-methyl-D-erythritol 4-phosphate cytidylyltransferase